VAFNVFPYFGAQLLSSLKVLSLQDGLVFVDNEVFPLENQILESKLNLGERIIRFILILISFLKLFSF